MVERASPLKPRVPIPIRSSAVLSFDVAWLRYAFLTSSFSIPEPLSVTRIKLVPPSLISTVILVAPASIEFSTSSFTIDIGRSITSPAAILSMVLWSSTLIIYLSLSLSSER